MEKLAKSNRPSLRSRPSLARLHGMDEAVTWASGLQKDIDAYRAGQLNWLEVDRTCFLSGPTGCGKTTFARALAASCGLQMVCGSYSAWLGARGGGKGHFLAAMMESFSEARRRAPALLVVDQLDSFSGKRAAEHGSTLPLINGLLAEIDGAVATEGLVLLGACSCPQGLDPALTRAGRLGRHIPVSRPNSGDLALILREHLGGDVADADLSWQGLLLLGATGADCEELVRRSRGRARAAGRPLQIGDIDEEILCGDRRSGQNLNVAAVHTAGHAAAAVEAGLQPQGITLLRPCAPASVPAAEGATEYLTARLVEDRLVHLLAGRAAEEVLLGAPTSLAGGDDESDLSRATVLATSAVTRLGLAPGMLTRTSLRAAAVAVESCGLRTRDAAGVELLLSSAYELALGLARKHRRGIQGVAGALVARHAIAGSEVGAILIPPAVAERPTRSAQSKAPRWLMPTPPASTTR